MVLAHGFDFETIAGLDVLQVPIDISPSCTIAIFCKVGSRYEDDLQAGIAHFLEHMVFKGTQKRLTSAEISQEVASLGGEIDAGTGYEFTFYYIKVPAYHFARALDIIGDIVLNPRYPEEEFLREKQVIMQEYMMYEDNPQRKLSSEFRKFIWGDHPLGRKIEGEPETLEKLTVKDLKEFHAKYYVKNNLLMAIGGAFDMQVVREYIFKEFDSVKDARVAGYKKFKAGSPLSNTFSLFRKQEAVDIAIGFKGFDRRDRKRLQVVGLLNTLLGGNPNSRLFQRVREQLGLAYYIVASHTDYWDDGLYTIKAGVAPDNLEKALQAVLQECRLLAAGGVIEQELLVAKEYMKGRLLLDLETSEEILMFYAFQHILYEKILDPNEIIKTIDAVTSDEVVAMASQVFSGTNTFVGTIGPVNLSDKGVNLYG